jgi:HEAT repeat protein
VRRGKLNPAVDATDPRRRDDMKSSYAGDIRPLLTGGDRRSIARSDRARALIVRDSSLVIELVALTADEDWLVAQRALDLLEKLAQDHPDWIEPHKAVFIGPLASSDKWEIRLQIVRALPLFEWSRTDERRVEKILLENVSFPQTFVRAWALDGLATLADRRAALLPIVRKHLRAFERSSSKALHARARQIRARLGAT